jgi:uncharacterized protein YdbL (DUF1318 family)
MTRGPTLKIRFPWTMILAALLAPLALATLSPRAQADSTEDALKQKFEARYPALRAAKDHGQIGETSAGFVEPVDPKYLSDPALKKLIDDENADRAELYKTIAAEAQTTPDVVAQRAGVHNFEEAEHGDYLKSADGTWNQKP